jgi:uncharacterized protein
MPIPCKERRLILFGRYPVPGRVKTRLAPLIGPLGAAELQRQWTERTLSVLLAARQAAVEVVYAGGSARQVRRWLGAWPVACLPQASGDLGRRMQQALRGAFERGARQVVLVGTDIPGLETRHVVAAFEALSGHDLVLGPSRDGGYWLIGCRAPVPVFEGIEWGTGRVLAQTLEAAAACRLSATLLEPLQDIDTGEDLRRHVSEDVWARPYLSVVIPTLNEGGRIARRIEDLRAPGIETIVADGGSTDGTLRAARDAGARIVSAPRGRARQQNAGAAQAAGRVLLFLHADTRLPRDYGERIFEGVMDPRVTLGAFRFKSDWDHWAMRWIERAVYARCALLRLPYGDQAFFLRQEVFEQAGGFPEVPLAEDLLLARSLARTGRVELLGAVAVTSARRWRKAGIARATLTNTLVAAGCLLGMSPGRLTKLHAYGSGTGTGR